VILPNPLARRLFLHLHALAEPPTGPAKGEALLALIDRLGFVQIDSISTVARAHHMILFARRQDLWRVGELSITRRDSFRKVYDLTSRVIPSGWLAMDPGDAATIHWACSEALDRLGFATSGELAAFWAAASPAEAQAWCHDALARGEIVEVRVEGADGSLRRSYARPEVAALAEAAPDPSPRLRILSPFDPVLRDRARAERLFGFRYRIEVFVPEAKRTYGYYVFPILEGDRLIGRIDMRAHRESGSLRVRALWPEAGVRLGSRRLGRLGAELDRLAQFAGCDQVKFEPDWLRETLPEGSVAGD